MGSPSYKRSFYLKYGITSIFIPKQRGINRFKGVVTTFAALEAEGIEMPDISSFKKWAETTNELSAPSLERAIAETNDEQLKKALEWSHAVNRTIEEKLAGNDKPVEGAKEGLEAANNVANVAIVSSANGVAVLDEWTRHELAVHVDVMLGQEAGTSVRSLRFSPRVNSCMTPTRRVVNESCVVLNA